MNFPEHLFEILEIVGTISFAVSGAMVAVRKRVDLFGVLVLGVITALGGGMLRDVIIGQIPPAMFENKRFVIMALISSLLVFAVARAFKDKYLSSETLIDQTNNVFDALGLGAFSVIGSRVAINAGFGDNLFLVVCMGMITGIGGGLIRDLMVMEIPFVLRKRVYAVASITGAILYALLDRAGVAEWVAIFAGVVWVFGMRMLATKYKWNLPKAIGDEDIHV